MVQENATKKCVEDDGFDPGHLLYEADALRVRHVARIICTKLVLSRTN